MLEAFIARVKRKSEEGENAKEVLLEEESTETEEEREVRDSREVWLDQMADQPDLDQFSPQVSIYSSNESEDEELPELLAGPQ